MRYWWVNQNRTYRQEISGGYLWSPKRKSNDARNPFYEFMREVAPGDVVFSFSDTKIMALGIARGYCHESPKPEEFGAAGLNWQQVGWRVPVHWQVLHTTPHPKSHINKLRPFLTERYAPLSVHGNGHQSVYLTEINLGLATTLLALIGSEADSVHQMAQTVGRAERESDSSSPDIEEWERRVATSIEEDPSISATVRTSLIQARVGQGQFRSNVQAIEHACRLTRVERPELLIASHIKPWRDGSNADRLDGENGLLLTPTIDHLFDRGFISFEDSGKLIVSPVADLISLKRMGIDAMRDTNVGPFSDGQRRHLSYHRDNVLRMASGIAA